MAHRAITINAFSQVRTIYTLLYMFVSFTCMWVCIVYVVKECCVFLGGSVNNWGWHTEEHALELYRPAERCVGFVETGTNS